MNSHDRGRHSAAIIIVGSEIVEGTVRDVNGQWLTERLQTRGIWPRVMSTVSDDECLIAQTVRAACASVNYVVVCGGLGCTPDDVTRRGVSNAFGLPLDVDAEHAAYLERTSSWARGELARAAATLPRGGPRSWSAIGTVCAGSSSKMFWCSRAILRRCRPCSRPSFAITHRLMHRSVVRA